MLQDIVIAGGVESMTRVPMFSNMPKDGSCGLGPNDAAIKARFNTTVPFFSQFVGAEMMSAAFGIDRAAMDAFAARSHAKAAAATSSGRFADEIVAVTGVCYKPLACFNPALPSPLYRPSLVGHQGGC